MDIKLFNIIIATDKNGGIGYKNNLPWKFSKDLIYFKSLTSYHSIFQSLNNYNNILIMGKNTWLSIQSQSQELLYRDKYVITNNYIEYNTHNYKNTKFFKDFNTCYLAACENKYSDIWVIGGRQIYNIAFKHWACNKVYFTLINGNFLVDTSIDLSKYNIKWNNQLTIRDINKNTLIEYDLIFYEGNLIHNIEAQYLMTLYDILLNGEKRLSRNGYTLSKFHKVFIYNLQDGFPLLTTKKMFWRGIVEELLFFIRGDTDTKKLSNKNIKIWNLNTNKEFLNKMNLNYDEGQMGPMYGYQWRFFNKPFNTETKLNSGIDQLKNIINDIINDPMSRRLLMTDFNPEQVNQGVLYPCHSIIIQFYIQQNTLNLSMYQRSGDMFLGVPFNIASTALLLHIIASITNLVPGIINLILGDYHIYEEHINATNIQLARIPYTLSKLKMKHFKDLDEVENATIEDFELENYQFHDAIKTFMIA